MKYEDFLARVAQKAGLDRGQAAAATQFSFFLAVPTMLDPSLAISSVVEGSAITAARCSRVGIASAGLSCGIRTAIARSNSASTSVAASTISFNTVGQANPC